MPKRKKHPRRMKAGDGQRIRFERVLDDAGVIKDRISVDDHGCRQVVGVPRGATNGQGKTYGR